MVLPTIRLLIDCTQRWSLLQKNPKLSVSNLQSIIGQIPTGGFLPMYFHAQNAAILIEIDHNNSNQSLISSWQVLLPTDTIVSSIQPQLSCFPVTTYRLSDRSYLTSTVHCELLIDFMKNTIEYPKSYKASREIMETKDVPVSHYVCQWWIQRFPEITIENSSHTLVQFNKKHRDQVRWNNGQLPFRRSGLWMTIKVIFQTILTKHLGHIGTIVYKLLITHFLTHMIYTRQTSADSVLSIDLLVYCLRKILRRLNKIETLSYMEIWVTSWSEKWMSQPASCRKETEHFQMLLRFFEDYQNRALMHYCPEQCPTDPIGYSRFLLTSLTIIRAMHQKLCQDKKLKRLQFHCIDNPNMMDLFEFLVLPNREDMMRARNLYEYFNKFTHQSYPDLLTNIEEENSFGVYFASQSTKINNCLQKIEVQVDKDKTEKIQEVRRAKDRYHRLMNSINGCHCTCYSALDSRQCRRCRIEQQADNIEVSIYECPIPSRRASALAVMFELRMPTEVRCYRDVLWLFINRSQHRPDSRMYEWLRVRPHSCIFEPLFTGPSDCKVKNEGTIDGQWKKRNKDIYDSWYDGQYESTYLSIDCLRGIFLVNGMSVGYLPEKIISNELYVRVFKHYIFQVQVSDSPNTYITKYTYPDDGRVRYEFHFDDQLNRLIVHERHIKTNDIFELIPSKCFETELPITFASEYSHWRNIKDQTIEFRPIHFKDPDFFNYKPYVLNIETGYLTATNIMKTQILVNQSSSLFQNWFTRYFSRLDEKPYVYMMRDAASTVIHIHLSRLAIAFKYDVSNHCFTSREYSNMCIDEDQWLGTLTGLKFGLLLSSTKGFNHTRKLIVPFGHVDVRQRSSTDHQIVTIQRKSSMPYAYQYFVFIMNDRLRIIQSTDSPTGWLYLALLHALTSHPLPDQYTGMTGMERAFQLLNSAGCWTDQPFDALSLHILRQIAVISPSANYSRQYCTCMQKINWKYHSIPYSLQHCGYYLIAKKLIDTSEKFNFMHLSPHSKEMLKLADENEYDEQLLTKLYWDYHHSYNPIARLSTEMEEELLDKTTEAPYHQTYGYDSSVASHEQDHHVNDMYRSGDVRLKDISEIRCFPLSQWLTDEYRLNIVWIGLLKLADSIKTAASSHGKEELERFQLLLDFLHYISGKHAIRSIYLQMLNTVLQGPSLSLKSVTFPPFTQYHNVQQISVIMNAIDFDWHHSASERRTIMEEMKHCLETGHTYKDHCRLATSEEKHQIKFFLKSWQLNRKLQTFLITIQNLICSFDLIPWNTRVPVYPQKFLQKAIEDHHQIEVKSTEKKLDSQLLLNAQQKYFYPNSNSFIKSTFILQNLSLQKQFPADIFSSIDDQHNHLSEIGNYFKNHLAESWKRLQSIETYHREYSSQKEITEVLQSFQQESTQFWKELIKSITTANEQLFQIGLVPRTTPAILISLFQQIWFNEEYKKPVKSLLTKDQCTLLGGLIVNWIVEQQLERALHFAYHNEREGFEKELLNTPHINWTPSKHLPWLIFELEMNITIRAVQVDVARHMMRLSLDDAQVRNIVMQMNMGEGKTSVIIPMLALSLCSPLSSLVRVIVLKSLFYMNYQSLRFKLGGLLNRRIFSLVCRRDMDFNKVQMNQIFDRLQQGLRRCDIILVSPEAILSFDLLTIDKCRRHEFDTARSMLMVQRWLKTFVRDVLDESDEILHCKYQLIYTVGAQQQVDGGVERWKFIQLILNLVKKFAADIVQTDSDDICYKPSKRKSAFPEFRLLSDLPFPKLSATIANDWLNQKSYRQMDKQCILSFIFNMKTSIDVFGDRFPSNDIQSFLILRGLLSAEVLLVALKKRYRVQYGVNLHSSFNRLMAVPFRAKDVPAERTEFGHPDIALLLTQLSYYYSGLNDSQILQCFNRLNEEERDPGSIYAEWISQEDENDVSQSITQWKGINRKDGQQEFRQICLILRYNMLVINYFLNHFVFPREAKQFPHKLVSSAWDLSSAVRTNIVTGFSGTNDTQLLLPLHIHQCDLYQLQQTDAIVVNNLLQPENENYQHLSVNAISETILSEIVNYEPTINVILDVGALFIDGTNRSIAIHWLKLSDKAKIDYAIYFESNCIVVCDRQFHHHSFLTSPASERLDRCVIYLDEVHTRGTDFKFPSGFKAAVTLGNGLTKDRFVQACMRMRKLGEGHSLTFWSSDEVHRQIMLLKTNLLQYKHNDSCQVKDILRWVYENTQHATWDGLHHWAVQSLSYQRKVNAFRNIQWTDHQQIYTDQMMEELAEKCLEPEILELKQMYGAPRVLQTISEIYTIRYQHSIIHDSEELHHAVLQRIYTYGGSKQRLSQFLDEEQQRELEQELEQEREQEHEQKSSRPVRPCEPILHEEIKRLCNPEDSMLDLAELPLVFCPLAYAFIDSTFFEVCQPNNWQPNFWISTEFQRVIENKEESLDLFLRPPRWIVVYRNEHIIFVNAFEANWLMGQLHHLYHQEELHVPSITTLRLLLPRLKRNQSIFAHTPALTIPHDAIDFVLPVDWLAQLFVFNGTIYFETVEEETAYCQCLALCLKPRTTIEEDAFENGWIALDGFVQEPEHRCHLQIDRARFNSNPLAFVKELLKNRNNTYASVTSHIGNIIYNSFKSLTPEQG
ncbi:unnamed protein product [Rotaria sp. Silwood1]|nr:unnamed protein product [Rotaria sp. Silwood1]